MPYQIPVERVKANRCQSNVVQKPGHTHWCRIVAAHPGEHLCICGRKWPGAKS